MEEQLITSYISDKALTELDQYEPENMDTYSDVFDMLNQDGFLH